MSKAQLYFASFFEQSQLSLQKPSIFKPIPQNYQIPFFLSHSPNGIQLDKLWSYFQYLTDPDALLWWFSQFSTLFIDSYQNWGLKKKNPKKSLYIIIKKKNIPITPKRKRKIKSFVLSNTKEENKDTLIEFIKKNQAHPPKLLITILRVFNYLKNYVSKIIIPSLHVLKNDNLLIYHAFFL
ncbi:eukaryotic translation initiation factor 4 gamma [Anaeramoeba flamelloides]|uniref:Eukaryotic translation initiation factor 4 gamma n=1 Tax=Anaeramoeba flamelloides TaxID=1746091 RepID=A0AAV7YHW4_9EUKA|nr:eukaryotic translation initiation factor 4 gamma [Anaeramoeba flamelloides]